MADNLEADDNSINIHEYTYLDGDKSYWPAWGAAFGSVMEWCDENGYGGFGNPTEKGRKAMIEYEKNFK